MQNLEVVSKNQIIEFINDNNLEIDENTIITFGCFSECLDSKVKNETLELLKHFLKKGNPVQISTKQEIIYDDFKELLEYFQSDNQLVVFISCACISDNDKIEIKASSLSKRLNGFEVLRKLGIPSCLYIKPFLKDITINDVGKFKDIINTYKIENVVVGSIFSSNKSEQKTRFMLKKDFYYSEDCQENYLISQLEDVCNVYTRSTQVLNKYLTTKFTKGSKN